MALGSSGSAPAPSCTHAKTHPNLSRSPQHGLNFTPFYDFLLLGALSLRLSLASILAAAAAARAGNLGRELSFSFRIRGCLSRWAPAGNSASVSCLDLFLFVNFRAAAAAAGRVSVSQHHDSASASISLKMYIYRYVDGTSCSCSCCSGTKNPQSRRGPTNSKL